jgi:hypothetical protein
MVLGYRKRSDRVWLIGWIHTRNRLTLDFAYHLLSAGMGAIAGKRRRKNGTTG